MGGDPGAGPHEGRGLRANPPGTDEQATGPRDPGTPTGFDRVVHLLVVGTGVLAWLVAGLLVLVSLTLEPRDGLGGTAALFKAVAAIGWLAIGVVVIRDARAGRRRALAVGAAAWAWVVIAAWLIGQTALPVVVG